MGYNKLDTVQLGGEDMKMNKSKLFWKLGDSNKHIICQPLDDEEEYYSFLKRQFDAGYRQIIVSSEAMIELIKDFVLEHGLKVYRSEFAEDDSSLSDDIDNLLNEITVRPVLFSTLIEKLRFLAETSSIDISRIYISGRSKDGKAIDLYIQSNGIVAANDAADYILSKINTLIERCLFG